MRSASEAPFFASLSPPALPKTQQNPCKWAVLDCTIAPVEVLDSGATVAGMEVIRLLGKGAFGHVYAVNVPGHDTPRALKIMSVDANNENMQRRFQREAEVIQRLESEFVPTIYDFGKLDDESPYILMELLQGQTLGELIEAEGGKLPWRRVLTLGVQACEALDVAHTVGVLHRDLKPDNLFVVGTVDDEQLKILDFGVATFVSGHTDRHGALTQTSAIVGTPHYMSPEQIRSTTIGVEADIYMLGVVLYECLTGHRPFAGETLGDLLGNVLSGEFRPIANHMPRTPRIMTNAIERAMSLEPERRFSDALAFGKALRQGRAAMSELPPKRTVAPKRRADPDKVTMPAAEVGALVRDEAPAPTTIPPSRTFGLMAVGAAFIVTLTAATTYLLATREEDPSTVEAVAVEQVDPPVEVAEANPGVEAEEPVEAPVEAAVEAPVDVPVGMETSEAEPPRHPVRPRHRPRMQEAPEPAVELPPAEPEPVPMAAPDGLINPFE